MQFYGKAEEAAKRIVDLFRSGDVPAALSQVFIRLNEDIPCRKWSWSNQLLTALAGFDDARGFRQWQDVGRHVRKGEHGFPILCPVQKPVTRTDPDTGENVRAVAVVGFSSTVVFGYEQTEGEPLPDRESSRGFVDALPLVDVAKAWGLSVRTFSGQSGGALGWYRPASAIALGVENLSTWAHELMHAADDRLGNLKPNGNRWADETVAELGGCVLLDVLGLEREADKGGCWDYIRHYAEEAKLAPIAAIQKVTARTCNAVALVLAESERLAAKGVANVVA